MLILESVRRCDLESVDVDGRGCGEASMLDSVSSIVGCVSGETTGESENLADYLLAQVLK